MIFNRHILWATNLYHRADGHVEQHVIRSQILASLALTFIYLASFITNPDHPKAVHSSTGWWSWWDQSQYLKGSLGFASGSLAAENQWYMPSYSLLAAIFYKLIPLDPFLLLDAALLVSGFIVFQKLAKLFGLSYLTAMLVFGASVLLPRHLFTWTWVVPWTTTPQTVCILLACVFVIKAYRESKPLDAFLFGLSASAVGLFRPVDTITILLPGSAVLTLNWLFTCTQPVQTKLRLLTALVAGVMMVMLFGLSLHLAIYGFDLSPYMRQSKTLGFEWRLIPIRWVALFIGSRPLYDSSRGLFEQCPWLILGIAGIIGRLFYRHKDAVLHRTIGVMLAGYIGLYLAYRDWHSTGLWKWGSVHYFTWIIPILGLYAFLWLSLLKQRHYRPALIGLVLALLFLCWRLVPLVLPVEQGDHVEPPRTVFVSEGLASLEDAIFVTGENHGVDSDLSPHHVWIKDRELSNFSDYRVFPTTSGMLIFPLRLLPPGVVRIQLADDITLKGAAPIYLQQKIHFGLPCWFATEACLPPLAFR